jgi:hypothetical protein
MWGGVAFSCPGRGAAYEHRRACAPAAWSADPSPYSTLPIFFTAAIRRALSSVTNFENSGASR